LIARLRRSGTIPRLIHRAVFGPATLEAVEVDIEDERSPQQALVDAASARAPGVTTLSQLCVSPHLSYKLFIVDVRGRDASRWLMLAGTFATRRAKADEGPALLLVTDETTAPEGCDFLDDGAFVGPPEAAVFAREHRRHADLLPECADAAAIEVSRGDVTLLSQMLALPDRDRFDPCTWVAQQPVVETLLPWRGHEERCATWLSRHQPARLKRRVWRGHVSVLFPWLAGALGTFLEKHARRLPPELPDKYSGAALRREDFEWGDIVFALNATAPQQANRAHRVRLVRNALAHRRAITWQEAVQVEQDVNGLLKWT
jgi:hypothetical protein